jgi:hypothetical protein
MATGYFEQEGGFHDYLNVLSGSQGICIMEQVSWSVAWIRVRCEIVTAANMQTVLRCWAM